MVSRSKLRPISRLAVANQIQEGGTHDAADNGEGGGDFYDP